MARLVGPDDVAAWARSLRIGWKPGAFVVQWWRPAGIVVLLCRPDRGVVVGAVERALWSRLESLVAAHDLVLLDVLVLDRHHWRSVGEVVKG